MKNQVKDYEDRMNALDEAQEQLADAIENLKFAVSGLPMQGHTEAYLIDHLECFQSGDHTFLTNDLNIDKVRESLRKLNDGDEDW